MKRIIITAIASVLLLSSALVVASSSASAGEGTEGDHRNCVIRAEYRYLHHGMTRRAAERIMATRGHHYSGFGGGWQYRQCRRSHDLPHRRYVALSFDHKRLVMKEWGTTRAF